ncbi:HAD family hydrolase [Lysinibacillus sp. NPDC093190]|uniref:HAD family hydrolase n=1 Tax=Lysinibacillus sp. NPDC093190 TaxID=3390575 RepID=UPI003CFF86C8
MLLFTSDLDRTLIYSRHMMDKFPPATATVIVEQKDHEVISMMTESTVKLLQQVHKHAIFVPVTTRALYQYERIHFIKEIGPNLAITSNGGTILENGRPYEEWTKTLRKRIEDSAIPKEDIVRHFQTVKSDLWLQRSFFMDELFYVHHVNNDILRHDELKAIVREFATHGWHVLLQGKKLYIMPKVLTKEAAITYMKEQLCTYDVHLAAGDSIMDYGMLAIADIAYTPHHGDLKDTQPQVLINATYSANNGEAFTKELLEAVMRLATKPIPDAIMPRHN